MKIPKALLVLLTTTSASIALLAFTEKIAVPETKAEVLLEIVRKTPEDKLMTAFYAAIKKQESGIWEKYIVLGSAACGMGVYLLSVEARHQPARPTLP